MKLEKLKQEWVSTSAPSIQIRMWNRASRDYKEKPLPKLEEDSFLQLLCKSISLHPQIRILDVGCGAGGYALALAPFVRETVGLDISDGMIQAAMEKRAALKCSNARFECINWSEANIDTLGLRNRFDIAFAHMTPAICDYATLEKLNSCSKNLCLIEKPARRYDMVLNHALSLVNITENDFDRDIPFIFHYLWNKGYEPQFYYQKEEWDTKRSTEDMVDWCVDRAMLKKPLSCTEKRDIQNYVEGLSKNGRIEEHTKMTRITIIWKKENVENGREQGTME